MTAKTAERRYSMVVSVVGHSLLCLLTVGVVIVQCVLMSWFSKDDFHLGVIAGSMSMAVLYLIGFAAKNIFSDWQRHYSPIPATETDK